MHRSRIGLVLIDHAPEHFEPSLTFWAGVQGASPVRDGRFAFDVEIKLPLIGRIAAYAGTLEPA